MPRIHDPVDTAKELLFELNDKPDPSLNYIKALQRLISACELAWERLISACELARDWAAEAVLYKGVWLDPNSRAFQLYQDKKFKELDQHMKECDERARKLEKGE